MQRRSLIFGIVVIAASLVLLGWGLLREKPLPKSPLDLLPKDTTAFWWIDVSRVRQSEVWRDLESQFGGARGASVAEERCGFDPLDMIATTVLFIATKDEMSFEGFALYAEGNLEHEKLLRCVSQVIGDGQSNLKQVKIEGITAMVAESGETHAAFVGSNGVAAGRKPVLTKAFRALRGKSPTLRSQSVVAELWNDVHHGRDSVLVTTLPERWRAIASQQLGGFEPRLGAATQKVEALALGVTLSAGIEGGLLIQFRDEGASSSFESAIRDLIAEALENPMVKISSVGSTLRRIQTERSGKRLVITARLSSGDLRDLIEVIRDASEVRLEGGTSNEPDPFVIRRTPPTTPAP